MDQLPIFLNVKGTPALVVHDTQRMGIFTHVTNDVVILENVVAEVRTEYVVGYYPAQGVKKGKHKAKIVLADKSLGKLKGGEKEYRR